MPAPPPEPAAPPAPIIASAAPRAPCPHRRGNDRRRCLTTRPCSIPVSRPPRRHQLPGHLHRRPRSCRRHRLRWFPGPTCADPDQAVSCRRTRAGQKRRTRRLCAPCATCHVQPHERRRCAAASRPSGQPRAEAALAMEACRRRRPRHRRRGGAVARPVSFDRPHTPAQAAAPEAAPHPVSKPTTIAGGSLALVAAQPRSDDRVLLDGAPAGETPLTIDSVAPGRHTVTFVTASGSVKKTVRVEAGKTVSLNLPSIGMGRGLYPCSARHRGKRAFNRNHRTGPTYARARTAPAHIQQPRLRLHLDQAVEIEPGEERSVNVQPTGELSLNALPWAEVWIDGQ